MKPLSLLHPYQHRGIQHVLEHFNAMLWVDMGLGKTIILLTAILQILDRVQASGILVVGSKRIVQSVWEQEAEGWEHTQGLRFSKVYGTSPQRIMGLRRRAHIYLVNYDLLDWLAIQIEHTWLRKGLYPPFSMVVYDEVTKLKNSGGKRFHAWHKISPYFSRRVGMTGEPAANGYKDLHGQFLMVDGGQRLGTSLQSFRDAFLAPAGLQGRSWKVSNYGAQQIRDRVSDITLVMQAEDYLKLPPVITQDIWIDLPAEARTVYNQMEEEFFAELQSGTPIEASNTGAKFVKCLQIASGAVYIDDTHRWETVHTAKMEALQDIVEEASGRPILLGYSFIHEAERIAQTHPERPQTGSGATFLSSKLGERELNRVLERWRQNEMPLLCGHPASMGHGLQLHGSDASSIVWFSLPWSLELYNQMNARMTGGHRRNRAITVLRILARGTLDEVVAEDKTTKATTQRGLKDAVQTYFDRRHRRAA